MPDVSNAALERAVRAKEPQHILEEVAILCRVHVDYWPKIDAAATVEGYQAVARDLAEDVELEARKGMINEHERAVAQIALEQV